MADALEKSFQFTNGNKAIFYIDDLGRSTLKVEIRRGDTQEIIQSINLKSALGKIQLQGDGDDPLLDLASVLVSRTYKPSAKFTWFETKKNKYLLFQDGTLSGYCFEKDPTDISAQLFESDGNRYILESYDHRQPKTYIKNLKDARCMDIDSNFHDDLEDKELAISHSTVTIPGISIQVNLKLFMKTWNIQYKNEVFQIQTFTPDRSKEVQYSYLVRLRDEKSFRLIDEPIIDSPVETPVFKLKDGILEILNVPKKIDLDQFDAEVRTFNRVGKADSVRSEDGGTLDAGQEIENNYQDWVQASILHPEDYTEKSDPEIILNIADAVRAKRSVVVLGRAGTGKTSALRAFARDVGLGKVFGIPRTVKIFEIKASNLASGTKYVGTIEKRMSTIVAAARKNGFIFFIDEIHSLSGLGTSEGKSNDVTQFVKGPIEKGELILLGTDTTHEFNNAFAKDPAFMDRFEQVMVKSPQGDQLTEIVKTRIQSEFQRVPELAVIQEAVRLSDEYDLVTAQPRAAINLLRKAYAYLGREVSIEDMPLVASQLKDAAVSKYKFDPALFNRQAAKAKVAGLMTGLNSLVIGQEDAKKAVVSMWKRKLSGVGDSSQVNSILFVGAPGIGKSKIAEASADLMGYKKSVIEMQKYERGDVEEFRRNVYSALLEHPFRLIILDEVENAPISVQEAALSMLQSGEFTVEERLPYGRTVSRTVNARHSLFIMTSNAAADYLEESRSHNEPIVESDFRQILAQGDQLREKRISKKILSRVQQTVPMYRPTQEEYVEGIRFYLKETLQREGKKHQVNFILEDQDGFIAARSKFYMPQSDFRDVKKLMAEIEERIVDILSDIDVTEGQTVMLSWDRSKGPNKPRRPILSYYN